jgi:hypothetical protein
MECHLEKFLDQVQWYLVHLDSFARNHPNLLQKIMIYIEKIREKQTILVSSCSKTCGYHSICCLSDHRFIEIPFEMIPTVPTFNSKKDA